MLTVHSSAKVNLTLDILSQRADGYHELQSVVHAIGLWDTLHFDFGFTPAAGVHLTCNLPDLAGDDNLCLKAARAWLEAAASYNLHSLSGIHIHLEKQIPMGAGLGGGSGNAAATLLALNRQYCDLLSENELLHVAAKIGADVPLFLQGGCALMEGIGDKLSPLPTIEGWLVIVQPPHGLSTPAVYRAWDELNHESGRATAKMLQYLNARALGELGISLDVLRRAVEYQISTVHFHVRDIAAALGNDLALAAAKLGFDVEHMKNVLRAHGALSAEMTGSGSAVFGIFANEAAARKAARRINSKRSEIGVSFVTAAPFCAEAIKFSTTP